MLTLKIAWRNLWRRSRRTWLTVSTISLGLTLLLVSLGLGDGSHRQMIDSAVRMGSGHLIIQSFGYQETTEIERLLSQDQQRSVESWVEKRKSQFPVRFFLRRVFGSGVASSSDGSTGVQMIGIEVNQEVQASLFDEKLVEGRFLHPRESDRVIIGEGIARRLRLKPGEKLVLMAQGAQGAEIQSILMRVAGIIRTGQEGIDLTLVLIPLKAAQDFLGLRKGIHQVAVFLSEEPPSQALADLGKADLRALEVLHWSEALPELRDYIRIDDGGNYVFHVFIFLLIAFTILNTLLMSVLERTRELALLDALGLTPAKRFAMVLLEASFLALLSGFLGGTLGYSIHHYLHTHGLRIDLFYEGDISAAGVILDPVLYSDLSSNRILGSILLVVALTILLALVPALRASRSGGVHVLGHG